jgi:riboflavin kinase/FMN adenylyltransferase
VLPLAGVYAVRASADGGPAEPAVANLGVRPTFEGEKFLVEVNLLDASPDLYGKELEVGFVRRIATRSASRRTSSSRRSVATSTPRGGAQYR